MLMLLIFSLPFMETGLSSLSVLVAVSCSSLTTEDSSMPLLIVSC